ncbi:MAG: branched-chain amino acid ABC transporter permease [Dehalococcoidia bacterium]|nr:branched-chain amino acid ABC transporter permease [Dehalococcoidia bacterium]
MSRTLMLLRGYKILFMEGGKNPFLLLLIAIIVLVAAAMPFILPNPYIIGVMVLLLLYITLATAWNLIGGYAGQASLGHAAFMGLGAYAMAILSQRFGISPWLGMAIGTLFATALSYPIGYICFRLRGVFFIMVTLAMAEILREISLNWVDLTNGARGMMVPPLFADVGKADYYWLALGIALLSILTTYIVTRSKLGYNLIAIREDERAAAAIGINTDQSKQMALAISAFFTGMIGAFYASYIRYIDPDVLFGIRFSLEMIFMPIVGGASTIIGPIVGALLLGLSAEYFRTIFKEANLLIYGVMLVLAMLVMPGGIVGEIKRLSRWARKRTGLGGKSASA